MLRQQTGERVIGYTHYWTQRRAFRRRPSDDITVPPCWAETVEHITAILNDVQHVQAIPLANGMGEPGTQPQIETDRIGFNGSSEDSHEDFSVYRDGPPADPRFDKKPSDRFICFCKTAAKPYDLAVTACLAYLEAVHDWRVTSDGDGRDWLAGVELARRVLPRFANRIDIPLEVRKGDRWDWRNKAGRADTERYDIRTCIDGRVYVFERANEANCYRFETVEEAHALLRQHIEPVCTVRWQGHPSHREGGKPLFENSGSFDKARHARIRRLQNAVLKALIARAPAEGRNIPPPAFARPVAMPKVAREQATMADLYELAA